MFLSQAFAFHLKEKFKSDLGLFRTEYIIVDTKNIKKSETNENIPTRNAAHPWQWKRETRKAFITQAAKFLV